MIRGRKHIAPGKVAQFLHIEPLHIGVVLVTSESSPLKHRAVIRSRQIVVVTEGDLSEHNLSVCCCRFLLKLQRLVDYHSFCWVVHDAPRRITSCSSHKFSRKLRSVSPQKQSTFDGNCS